MASRFAKELATAKKITRSEIALRGDDFSLDQLIERQELFQEGMQLSAKKQWAKAEQVYKEAIDLGDCLPQPWGNLGVCLMMRKQFDKAEAAFRRALKLDSKYKLAKSNLKKLAYMRENPDFEPEFRVSSPFAGINTTLIIIDED